MTRFLPVLAGAALLVLVGCSDAVSTVASKSTRDSAQEAGMVVKTYPKTDVVVPVSDLKPGQKVAYFNVKEMNCPRSCNGVKTTLANEPGVVMAKTDAVSGNLAVVYLAEKTDEGKITERLGRDLNYAAAPKPEIGQDAASASKKSVPKACCGTH